MTVNATPRVAGPFAGNGASTVFPFAFKVYSEDDLRVVLTDTGDVETVAVLDSDYSVSLNADQETAPGGSITYPLAGAPLAAGHKITVVGATAATQPLDVTNQGGFYPQVIEDALDRTTILAQENADAIERCVKVAVSSDIDPDQLVADIVASESAAASSAAQSAGSANAAQVSADDSATSAAASAASAAASLASANNSATSATAAAGSATAAAGSATAAAGSAGTAAADAAAGADAAMAASLAAAATSASDAAASAAAASSAFSAFKNKIINGNFDFWQRGTSQITAGYGCADRWVNSHTGSTKTVSRQEFTPGQTAVPGNPKYFARTVVTGVAGAPNYTVMQTRVENVSTLAGVASTFSFWAKADSPKNLAVDVEQVFGAGGSSRVSVHKEKVALTASWQKFTMAIPAVSISGKTIGTGDHVELTFWFDSGTNYAARSSNLGTQSGTFDIAQVQWEEGPTATAFEQRPLAIESVLCQRYYERSYSAPLFSGWVSSGSLYYHDIQFSVAKRAQPTVLATTTGNSYFPATDPTVTNQSVNGFNTRMTANGTNATAYFQYQWTADAEL